MRRCWGSILCDPNQFVPDALSSPRSHVAWHDLYRAAVHKERKHLPREYVVVLKEQVPGVEGLLVDFVCVKSERYRIAARCCLRRLEILVRNMVDGFKCMEALRESRNISWPASMSFVSPQSENEAVKSDIGRKLDLVRGMGGSCEALLDCLLCRSDSSIDSIGLLNALRKVVGATAICSDVAEAKTAARTAQCDVVCCQGDITYFAEFRKHEFPDIAWSRWHEDSSHLEPVHEFL